jgi:hypothetical protein
MLAHAIRSFSMHLTMPTQPLQNEGLQVSLESSRQVLLKKMLACVFPFLKLELCRKHAGIPWKSNIGQHALGKHRNHAGFAYLQIEQYIE